MSCAVTSQDPNTGGSDTAGLLIRSRIGECWLGSILVATTDRGICAILLGDDPAILRRDLEERFPQARIIGADQALDPVMAEVEDFIAAPGAEARSAARPPRHGVPAAGLAGAARDPGRRDGELRRDRRSGSAHPRRRMRSARRARRIVIAVAIPCHRVVRKNGGLAGYRWGFGRKRALLERERAQ